MTTVSVIRPYKATGANINDADGNTLITFDATLSYQYAHSSTGTKHPIEDGSTITDHIQKDPDSIVCQFSMTNTPLTSQEIVDEPNRDYAAWEMLRLIWERSEIIQVVTPRRVYDNVFISNMSDTETGDTPQEVNPTVTFDTIKTVTQENVQIPQYKLKTTRVKNNAPKTSDKGRQGTESSSTGEEEKSESLLTQLLGIGG